MEKLLESGSKALDAIAAYFQAAARHADAMAASCIRHDFPIKTAPCTDRPTTKTPVTPAVGHPAADIAGAHPLITGKPESGAPSTGHAIPPEEAPATRAPEKRKAGRPKKTDAAPAAPAAPSPKKDDAPAGLPVDPEFASLNEEESTKRVYEIGEAMMDAYPKEEAGKNAPDGSPAPEGFFIAADILKTRFNVEKLSKLNHAQRLQFMTILKGYLGRAQSAPQGESSPETDPNLGV